LFGGHPPSFYGVRRRRAGGGGAGASAIAAPRRSRYARRVLRHLALPRLGSPGCRAAGLCAGAVLAFGLAGPGAPAALSAGLAPNAPLQELTGGAGETTPTRTTTSTASTETTSNSSTVIVLALAAAAVLLIGIAFVIVRDARRVAPVPDGQLPGGAAARDPAAELRRRRAKAKAARRQRKRNR
jgi:hypothetical protein